MWSSETVALRSSKEAYIVTVTPTASGTVTVDVAAGAAQDSARNLSEAADQFSIAAGLMPVPALPLAGAIALSLLLFVSAARRRPTS